MVILLHISEVSDIRYQIKYQIHPISYLENSSLRKYIGVYPATFIWLSCCVIWRKYCYLDVNLIVISIVLILSSFLSVMVQAVTNKQIKLLWYTQTLLAAMFLAHEPPVNCLHAHLKIAPSENTLVHNQYVGAFKCFRQPFFCYF